MLEQFQIQDSTFRCTICQYNKCFKAFWLLQCLCLFVFHYCWPFPSLSVFFFLIPFNYWFISFCLLFLYACPYFFFSFIRINYGSMSFCHLLFLIFVCLFLFLFLPFNYCFFSICLLFMYVYICLSFFLSLLATRWYVFLSVCLSVRLSFFLHFWLSSSPKPVG